MDFLRELFSQLPPPFNMVVVIMAIIFGVGFLSEIVKQVRVFADHEADRRLKREMIESGLSPDEAQQIASMKVTEEYKSKKNG